MITERCSKWDYKGSGVSSSIIADIHQRGGSTYGSHWK